MITGPLIDALAKALAETDAAASSKQEWAPKKADLVARHLEDSGFAIVPLEPTADMLEVAAMRLTTHPDAATLECARGAAMQLFRNGAMDAVNFDEVTYILATMIDHWRSMLRTFANPRHEIASVRRAINARPAGTAQQ
jgi:hypothetical protein